MKRKLTTIGLLEMRGKARLLFEDELPKESERILITKKMANKIKKFISLMKDDNTN